LCVIKRNIILSEIKPKRREELLEKIIKALNADFSEIYDLGIENLHNLMLNQENETFLENLLPRFIKILIKFLMNNNNNIVERVLEIICHFSDMKISTRVLFAKQNYFFSRLLGNPISSLIVSNDIRKFRKDGEISKNFSNDNQ
jgi:hypothetical protein